MANPLSNDIVLATSMHAQPGVYAVLLGSGASIGAGVPTGWGVVRELTARVATLSETGDSAQDLRAGEDPEGWWSEKFGEQLGYSSLLEKLADTPAERQGLLKGFFEPADDGGGERSGGPSAAHRAIAVLAKRGYIKVIVTTNFDRLMEQALAEVGVEPQIVSRPDAVKGMVPLAHAPVTLVKLHGDYREADSLNTESELAEYPPPWIDLLRMIVEDYGLVISGWSADWDTALARAIADATSRRYTLFWDARSSGGENAKRLLNVRQGKVLDATSADDLFSNLSEDIEALESLARIPLSLELAVAKVKKYLPNPVDRVQLRDLIMSEAGTLVDELANLPRNIQTATQYQSGIQTSIDAAMPLLRLATVAASYDDGTHDDLLVDVLASLFDSWVETREGWTDAGLAMTHLPAQLYLYAVGATAIARHRDRLLLRLAAEPEWARRGYGRSPRPAMWVLHTSYVLERDLLNSTEAYKGGWWYPAARLLVQTLSPVVAEVMVAPKAEESLRDALYRVALLQHLSPGTALFQSPQLGEYHGEYELANEGDSFESEQHLLRDLRTSEVQRAWDGVSEGGLDEALGVFREYVREHRRDY